MKVAVIGSRNLRVDDLGEYLPEGVTEIVSGGARGIDTCARNYALAHGLKLTEFLPEYEKYGRGAAFWDGRSRGTKFVIDNCKKRNIPVSVYRLDTGTEANQI